MDIYQKFAKILHTTPEDIKELDKVMSGISGQTGVMEAIDREMTEKFDHDLKEFGLNRSSSAESVYGTLIHRFETMDMALRAYLGNPDLFHLQDMCGMLCWVAFQVFKPPKGFFIKKEKVVELLERYRPTNMIEHFGYSGVKELVDKEGFASVVSALRFTQDTEWMHKFFGEAYNELTADDFEEREVEVHVLDPKWLEIAEKFMAKKHHNVSHLKEYGVIFVIPQSLEIPGETMRMFVLILHYLHEVPYYSGLFRKFVGDSDFVAKLQSLLRGDVLELDDALNRVDGNKRNWLIIQRYLAKDDINDPRLSIQHLNPEAEHYVRVTQDLSRLSRMIHNDGVRYLENWTDVAFVGEFFKNKDGKDEFVTLELMDLVMSLVKTGGTNYNYHQREALWNKIFYEYMGHEYMNRTVEENIIRGHLEL